MKRARSRCRRIPVDFARKYGALLDEALAGVLRRLNDKVVRQVRVWRRK